MRKNRFLYLLACCFLFSLLSCEEKNEADDTRKAIAGTWQLISVQIDGTAGDLSGFPDLIQFQSNQIFQSYHTDTNVKKRGGWSYESDMLNISPDLPAAYYILHVDAQKLSLKRLDFNAGGGISNSVLEYRRVSDSEIPEKTE